METSMKQNPNKSASLPPCAAIAYAQAKVCDPRFQDELVGFVNAVVEEATGINSVKRVAAAPCSEES